VRRWKLLAARRRGRQDAEAGVFLAQEIVDEMLGPRPSWDPLGPEAETIARAGELTEYGAILREEQGRPERSHVFPRPFYLASGLFFVLVEAVAMAGLLRDLGVSPASRTVLALMLAAFAVWITHAMMEAYRRSGDGRVPSSLGALAALAGFTLFAVSVAMLRLEEWGPGSDAGSLVQAVFWTAASLGPALLAEALFARYMRATVPRNVSLTYGRERRRLERQVARALGQRADLLRREAEWERDAARLTATYTAAYRAQEAELARKPMTKEQINDTTKR
jgi:hypothetical protein